MRYYRGGKYYYRRRRKRRRRSYDYNATPSNTRQYVEKCFFSLSTWQFVAFTDYYGNKYGDNARRYLQRTYKKWKSGETGMSGETGRRILECVPRFLGRQEQFQLLQFCIPSILSKWKTLAKARTQNTEELHATFSKIAKLIKEDDYELEWFVTNVFSQEEIDEFMGVLRYTMLDTLDRSYNSVREDISFLYSNVIAKLSQIDASVTLEYSVNLLGCRLQLTHTAPVLVDNLMQDIRPPDMVTKFNKEYRKILLDYSIGCIKHDAHDPGRKHVGLYDLDSLLNTVENIQDHNEYSARLAIEGSGGDFSIRIEKKNQSKIAFEIFKRAVALALVLLAVVLLCIFFTTIVLAGWWLFIVGLFSLLSWLIGDIRDLCTEMKEYERRKTKRFAEN